jgi:hypothetical protein
VALAAPSINKMFEGLPSNQRPAAFEAYKDELDKIHSATLTKAARGEIKFQAQVGIQDFSGNSEKAQLESLRTRLTEQFSKDKSASADDFASITSSLSLLEEATKDWTNTNPLNAAVPGTYGLVPFDLSPALAMLVPKHMDLVNSIPRTPGQGTATQYRRILGVSNSNSGGVANLNLAFTSATASTAFGPVNLARPKKISYAADYQNRPYCELGVSDEVLMQAQFASQGFTDLRSLSHTAVMWATKLGEERLFLNGRGGGSLYLGALNVSGVAVVTALTAGGSLPAASTIASVTFLSSYGETAAIAGTARVTTGGSLSVTVSCTGTIPSGAISANIYTAQGTTYTVTGTTALTTLFGAGIVISAPGATVLAVPTLDASAGGPTVAGSLDQSFDGIVAVALDTATSGYVKNLNGATLSTSVPGSEFQTGFAALYSPLLGDPEEILLTGAVRAELSAAIIASGGTASGYRIQYAEDIAAGGTVGRVATGIQNMTTGTVVDLTVHPYLPNGVAIFRQKELPFPDSGVASTADFHCVTDWVVLDWPEIQMSYDCSTYCYGTMRHFAPAWQGGISGIG